MKAWWLLAAYSVILYLSIPLARDLQNGLKAMTGSYYNMTINAVLVVSGMAGLSWFIWRLNRSQKALVTILMLVMIGSSAMLEMPEERIHILEYGVLGYLAADAASKTWLMVSPVLAAILIGTLVGITDELIQLLLPDRFFDSRDILFNSYGTILGAGLWIIVRKSK